MGTAPQHVRVAVTAVAVVVLIVVASAAYRARRVAFASIDAAAPEVTAGLAVEVSGCAGLRVDGTCELGEARTVRFVVAGAPASLTFESDRGVRVAPRSADRIDDAVRYTLDVPGDAGAIVVRDGATPSRSFRVSIAPVVSPAWLREARELHAAGEPGSGLAVLAALTPHLDAPGGDAAFALALAGRVRMRLGEHAAAAALLRRAVERHRGAGRVSDAVDDALALAFVLTDRLHEYAAARAVLDAADKDAERYPDGRAAIPYYRAVVARWTRSFHDVATFIALAEARARRLGLDVELQEAQALRAMHETDHGRFDEACARLRALLADTSGAYACGAPRRRNNLAILTLDATEALGAPPPSCVDTPEALLETAWKELETTCREEDARAFNRFVYARARLARGDLLGARQALVESRAHLSPLPDLELGWRLLDAAVDLRVGQVDRALEGYALAERAAEALAAADEQLEAILGRARAFEAKRDATSSLAEYRRADALADEAALRMPLGMGRHAQAAAVERATRAHLELLVREGALDEARRVIASSHARTVRDLMFVRAIQAIGGAQRERWESALGAYQRERNELDERAAKASELAERDHREHVAAIEAARDRARQALADAASAVWPTRPATTPRAAVEVGENEVVLTYHRGSDGWIGLATTHGWTRVARFKLDPGTASREELARALLEPFARELESTSSVIVVGPAELASIDVHALPWKSSLDPNDHAAPLAATHRVAYSVAGAWSEAPPFAAALPTLLVDDPNGNLPGARREGARVAEQLAARGARVVRLTQADATTARVRAELASADRFHFAGHAEHDPRAALRSGLVLAQNARFDVADILALPRVPRSVVLTACHGAEQHADAVGLAQAFVLAGARAVVAATRAVSDRDAVELASALYALPADGGGRAAGLETALGRAQAELSRGESAAWSSYRLFVP